MKFCMQILGRFISVEFVNGRYDLTHFTYLKNNIYWTSSSSFTCNRIQAISAHEPFNSLIDVHFLFLQLFILFCFEETVFSVAVKDIVLYFCKIIIYAGALEIGCH